MARKKKVVEDAECGICGAHMTPSDEEMLYHLATVHPLELMRHPKMASSISQLAYSAGEALAKMFGGKA